MEAIPFHHSQVGGMPCFWADAPGRAAAGLVFRVGLADERLAGAGITRLVQRTALAGFGGHRHDYDGRVDLTTTTFWATGSPADVAEFVRDVGRALTGLEGSPFADAPHDPGTLERMLMMRFGAAGHGLAFYEPFGLRKLGLADAREWARCWFTRANAALWMTCPPPDDLRIDLPDGPRVPAPEPHPIPALRLPAFAAAGDGEIASAMVAPRSAAIGAAGRTVAGRARHELGLPVETWQMPLTAALSHRFLSAGGTAGDVAALARVFDAVAADGPTREELADAADAAVEAIRADAAVAGGLERMAVDELLGAPRRWKEDLILEARSVSYAEAAAALREALSTQILLAPADAAKPAERYHDYPWFSPERPQGLALRPLRRELGAHLIASQEGIAHVGDKTGTATTVRFAELAAALQEPDGSLTLVGRDGAVVPIDPHAFKGAGKVVSDLEMKLAPELIVPPADAGVLEQIARRKLRPRVRADEELRLLRDRLGHEERVVTLSEAVIGFKWGVLVVTDRRLVWLHRGPRDPLVREMPYGDVVDVRLGRIPSHVVRVKSRAGETAFSSIQPRERAAEIVEEVRRRTSVRG